MEPEQRRLTRIIREILLHEWDPIGVSGIPEAADEYDNYADVVANMLLTQSPSAEDIHRYLYEVATEHMGLSYPTLAARCEKASRTVAHQGKRTANEVPGRGD